MRKTIACMIAALAAATLFTACPNPADGAEEGDNADLYALMVSVGTLSPAFEAGTTAYTVDLPNDAAAITVTGMAADAGASLSANSGVAQDLAVGANAITLTVTARDGTSAKDYVVTVNRARASEAGLASLTVSAGTLVPAFASGTSAYTVSVPNATASITVTGTKADADASLSANSGVAQDIAVGANTVTITVTAEDGTSSKDYVVTVRRLSFELPMVVVPVGSFQRDAAAANVSVFSAGFRMSPYEITRAQFLDIMGTDPSDTSESSGSGDPVQKVNLYHAIAFCNKLSLAEGFDPVYAVGGVDFGALRYADVPTTSDTAWDAVTADWGNGGYRLPTEMEWMWAAMGAPADGRDGGTNASGYAKAFAGSTGGNAIGDYAVFGFGSGADGRTETPRSDPVGSRLPNELGLYDMSGNVGEWCWDWEGAYPSGLRADFRGPDSGSNRVYRGGNWSNPASACAVEYRHANVPYLKSSVIGFRVVRR